MQEPARISTASVLPVSLVLLKAQVHETDGYQDELLEFYLSVAAAHVENMTGRAITETSWRQVLDGFPEGGIVLPFGPLKADSLTITYLDASEATQAVDVADLIVDGAAVEARIDHVLGVWPDTSDQIASVTLEWVTSADPCPPELAQAVLMLAAHYFGNREAVAVPAVAEVPLGVKALIATQRRFK